MKFEIYSRRSLFLPFLLLLLDDPSPSLARASLPVVGGVAVAVAVAATGDCNRAQHLN